MQPPQDPTPVGSEGSAALAALRAAAERDGFVTGAMSELLDMLGLADQGAEGIKRLESVLAAEGLRCSLGVVGRVLTPPLPPSTKVRITLAPGRGVASVGMGDRAALAAAESGPGIAPPASPASFERSPASADLTVRVCPRCGAEASEQRFCAGCGLNLAQQTEIPTRTEWDAASQATQGERADEPDQTTAPSEPAPELVVTPPSTERSGVRGGTLIAVAIAVGLTLIIYFAATGGGILGGGASSTSSGGNGSSSNGTAPGESHSSLACQEVGSKCASENLSHESEAAGKEIERIHSEGRGGGE